jgi:hypothetical protein
LVEPEPLPFGVVRAPEIDNMLDDVCEPIDYEARSVAEVDQDCSWSLTAS